MTHACDVERVIAEDRKLLIRRGDRFILIDLDERKRNGWPWALLAGAMLWGLFFLAVWEWRP